MKYTEDESMFYGLTKIGYISGELRNPFHYIYFFYGYLPVETDNDSSLNDIFSLNEIIYYKSGISFLYLQILRLLPKSRINTITSSNRYLNHIVDTFSKNKMTGTLGEIPIHFLKKLSFSLFFLFGLYKAAQNFPLSFKQLVFSIPLIILFIKLFSSPYTDLYIFCGLE